MNYLEKNILDIASNNYSYLLNFKNVHGVGLGYKYINDINTLEPCIHVLVNKKIYDKYLPKYNIIPKTYMGIKTDIIETGTPKFRSNVAIPYKLRPLKGGYSISCYNGKTEGTLGCIVTKKNILSRDYYILSNNHVLCELNDLKLGTPILQPSDSYGGKYNKDVVAHLSNFVPIKFVNDNNNPENYVDCAIAKINKKNLISDEIFILGKITGVSKAYLNQSVKKVGFVSGLTSGTVKTIGVTDEFEVLNNKKILFKNQILANLSHQDGDSGSIVVNDKNEVVGLLCAGIGDDLAIINDIELVLQSLKVEIYIKQPKV